MARVLVTGANGHLGCNLVRELLGAGHRVVALVRPGADHSGLGGLDLERISGDVLDPPSIRGAVQGCELVFHAAAPYLVWARDPDDIVRPAVEGTENVLRAAKAAGVRRVVFTSSSNAVGFTSDPQRPLDELSWNEAPRSPYVRAKTMAERRVWALSAELDLPVVAVLPTAVLGRFDYRVTPTTAPVLDAVQGRGPVPFAMNLVDVRDVARAHVLAAERGKPGERYLAGGQNVTTAELAEIIWQLAGIRPKQGLPPYPVLLAVATVADLIARRTGKPPIISPDIARESRGGRQPVFDCSKIQRELGLAPRSAEQVVSEVIRWGLFLGRIREPLATTLRGHFTPDPSWPRPSPR